MNNFEGARALPAGSTHEKPTVGHAEKSVPPAFAELTPEQVRDLEAGPLNLGWLQQGISHSALENLPEEVMADMRRYAVEPRMIPEERRALASRIRAAVEEAGDRYFPA